MRSQKARQMVAAETGEDQEESNIKRTTKTYQDTTNKAMTTRRKEY